MRSSRFRWRYGLVGVGLIVALALGPFAAVPSLLDPLLRSRMPLSGIATHIVRRIDLNSSARAGGRIDSTDRTIIECQLESLAVGNQGGGIASGGASTILSVIPDGSTVKEKDVLCVLDASEYEELLRLQKMTVERARADLRQAQLDLEVAKTALSEYRDGLMLQTLRQMQGQVSLAESDYERGLNRLEWSRSMLAKGYLSRSSVTNDAFLLEGQSLSLTQNRTALRLFEKFSAPKYLRILESDILMAETMHMYQTRRVQRHEERLATLERQVENCTIRAPHDGFLIYANEDMRNIRIEPGLAVRQRQPLFYLPDLSRMEVATLLHESIVKDIEPGMLARVSVEGLPNRVLEGHVTTISPLPLRNPFSDVRYYIGVVKLDAVPEGLKPGMSADVEILTIHRPSVLAIPSEALTVEQGRDFCYVAVEDHLERREITLGQWTRDMLEVTDGLNDGEQVVLDPTHLDPRVEVTLGAEPDRDDTDHDAQ
jgi:HlyD family secretion protein